MPRRLLPILVGLAACAPDDAPKIISSSLIRDTPDAHGPYRIVSVVQDDRRTSRSTVYFTTDGSTIAAVPLPQSVSMISDDGETWIGELPGLLLGTVVTWAVAAEDNRGQIAIDPPLPGGHRFIVGNVPSRPDVLTLWPVRGPTSGKTEVLIVGEDFREGMVARFGANVAETLELISRTQIRVRTPRGPVGFVDVWVENQDGGKGVEIRGFEYFPAPEIFEVVPNEGPTSGGTRVRIIGTRFAEGAVFYFDDLPCFDIVIISATEAACTTPAHPEGFADVSIVHATLGEGTKEDAFYYVPPPEIFSITPVRGPDLGGTRVRIMGDHFQPGARVLFDDRAAQVISVREIEIEAITPPHPVGFADLRVINPDDQSDTLADAFFFFGPPEIHSIEPPYAASEGGAIVTVVGANFVPETIIRLDVGGQPVHVTCTFIDERHLSCVVPAAPPDRYDVTATNPDGRSDTLEDGLTYFQILAVDPIEGPESGGNAVRITGVNLPRTSQIFFGGAPAPCTFRNETWIDCFAPPGPGDTFVDVDVLPPDPGQVPSRLVDGYYYIPAPVVLSARPDSGPLRGGQTVTIIGRHFEPGATVTINGNACTNVVFVSSTELRCVVPPGVPGLADVRVTNPDGQWGSNRVYEYVPIEFTPRWGLVDGFANMVITGRAFAPNAAVTIGGQPAEEVVFISAEEIRARAPSAANTGPAQVVVTNPGEPPEISPTSFSYRVYRNRSRPDMAGSGETSDVLIVDLDGDGDNDLVYVNGGVSSPSESQTLENLGGGLGWRARFLGSVNVANEGDWCDYDRDGDPDLVWGVSSGPIVVYRNAGNFNFNALTLPTQPGDSFEASFHQVVGDFRCDLINFSISGPDTVLHNNGGTFVVVVNAIPDEPGFIHDHKIDSADFDGDGDNDLVAVVDDVNFPSSTQRNRIYLNDGNGSFTEDVRNMPLMTSIHGDIYDVRAGDIDLDGDPDIVMPVYADVPVVLINDGTGVFSREFDRLPNEARGDSALFLEDIEGDGDLDLYLVSLDGPVGGQGSSALFLNDGRGFFFRAFVGEPVAPPASYRAAAGDLNGDGASDIVFGVVFGSNRMDWAEE